YRSEWLRYVETMAGVDALTGRLHQRAIKATADLLDCAGGALYVRTRHSGFRLAAELEFGNAVLAGPPPESLLDRLTPKSPVVDLTAMAPVEEPAEREWCRAIGSGWVLLGLQHRGRMVGALLVASPRVRRPLSWEDRDLLQIFSAQIGSYVAEEQVTLALAEARRFERISKNFSFIAHDLKNLVTQLSLIVSQAKRHGDNPDFQKDALSTVADSVEKMRTMLLRLRDVQAGDDGEALQLIRLGPLVADLFQRKGAMIGRLTVGQLDGSLQVRAEPTTLAAVLENLVQNALDAVGDDGHVSVGLVRRSGENRPGENGSGENGSGEAVIAIEDDGVGMTQQFIDDHLFQPFVSTKETGFGLGMYQCREWVERWNGRLELQSAPGQGTTALVVLPIVPDDANATSANQEANNANQEKVER
ncbi:MAG: PEP-CTERM system histidine kinase PrsK, partial [Alphaproteobacteria bacterium]|nr:PEP-CTERM system histidine kinase PrsK [Alphaproteobacteria bacterium]